MPSAGKLDDFVSILGLFNYMCAHQQILCVVTWTIAMSCDPLAQYISRSSLGARVFRIVIEVPTGITLPTYNLPHHNAENKGERQHAYAMWVAIYMPIFAFVSEACWNPMCGLPRLSYQRVDVNTLERRYDSSNELGRSAVIQRRW